MLFPRVTISINNGVYVTLINSLLKTTYFIMVISKAFDVKETIIKVFYVKQIQFHVKVRQHRSMGDGGFFFIAR